jgi:H/ACA ribonucleoprotein complex subunit 2
MIPIARPLASAEVQQRIVKLISKRDGKKLRTGVKACQKAIEGGMDGLLVLTADTTPMDLISHLPVLCEEEQVKYVFVGRKKDLPRSYTCVFLEKEEDSEMNKILEGL